MRGLCRGDCCLWCFPPGPGNVAHQQWWQPEQRAVAGQRCCERAACGDVDRAQSAPLAGFAKPSSTNNSPGTEAGMDTQSSARSDSFQTYGRQAGRAGNGVQEIFGRHLFMAASNNMGIKQSCAANHLVYVAFDAKHSGVQRVALLEYPSHKIALCVLLCNGPRQ